MLREVSVKTYEKKAKFEMRLLMHVMISDMGISKFMLCI